MDAALGLPSGTTALAATVGAVLMGAVLVRVCRKDGKRAVLSGRDLGVGSGAGDSTAEERLTTIRDLVALVGPPGGGKTTLLYEVRGLGSVCGLRWLWRVTAAPFLPRRRRRARS